MNPDDPRRPTLYLVDASMYVFRAWHSMPDEFHDAEGWPTNAVQGFARFLLELLERERPGHVVVAFDEALDSCFRNALYPAYKANRDPAPEELKRQFGADKDLSQLLEAGDEQWDFARGQRWGMDGVKDRQGVHAHQVADYLALCGDAVDNIPGVPGIGAKTAALLLAHFDTLDALLERVEEIPFLRFRGAASTAAKLRAHGEQARLFRKLTTIACDAPLDHDRDFARGNADGDALQALCEAMRFGPMTRRRLHEAAGLEFMPA